MFHLEIYDRTLSEIRVLIQLVDRAWKVVSYPLINWGLEVQMQVRSNPERKGNTLPYSFPNAVQ